MAQRTTFLLILMFGISLPTTAEEPRSLALSGGVSNFNKEERWVEGGLEFRTPIDVWSLAFAAGVYANDGSALWAFGGLRRDFAIHGPWTVTPAFAISVYEPGDGKELGGPIEFRSSLEIGYRWPGARRLAFAFSHLSNAGIYDRNPGMNSLILTYSLPFKSERNR